MPAVLQSVTLLRGDGFALDRFRRVLPEGPAYMVAERRGHLVSRFPIGAPAIAAPLVAPQLWALDVAEPDWERDPARAWTWARRMSKHASAAIAAATGVAIDRTLLALGLGASALPATLIAALGSNLWMTASQSPWQHGPAAFALAVMLALLLPEPISRARLVLAGGACALIACSRPGVGFLSLLAVAWVAYRHRRRAGWFLALPCVLGGLVAGYNLFYFGHPLGGYHELMHIVGPETHAVGGYWDASFRASLPGALVSANRGLFVFAPWIPLALATLPAVAPALRPWPLVRVLLLGIPILLLQVGTQSTWWGGWSFGPRLWTDVVPLFAIVLGFALAWARRRAPAFHAVLLAAGGVAIAIQAFGAFHYPSSFNHSPNVDHHHERLWSWRDGELARGWREGPHGWE
jgi:hypothetical protein